MIDVIEYSSTINDLSLVNTATEKAKNLLTTQLEILTYAPDFGVDLEYFLSEDLQFLNESFKNYLLQRMAENLIDTTTVLSTIENFYQKYTFNLAEVKQDDSLMG